MSEIKTNKISSLASNNDITIDPDGTGDTIIASGNVGINNSSPGSYYSNSNQLVVGSGSARQGITIASSTSTIGQLAFADGTSGDARYEGWVLYDHNTNHMSLGTSASERMRLDSSGLLLINTTSTLANGAGAKVQTYGASGIATAMKNDTASAQTLSLWNSGSSGTRYFVWFETSSSRTHVGSITSSGSSTSFNTSSDYRLKTAVTYDWDATTRLKQLKPARFKWISDGDDAVFVDGFIADEAQTVVPESVTGTKDEVDADGNAVMQGIDQSKLVPLLTKALIESVAKIEALEARITALEAE